MNGDSILLIGIDNTKVNLKQIYSTNKTSELMDLYGTESIFIEPFNILKNQGLFYYLFLHHNLRLDLF